MSSEKVAQMARRSKKVGILDLEAALKDVMAEYGDDVYKVLGEAVDKVADEAVQKLHSGGSFGGTGAYNRDWTATDDPVGRFGKKKIVHNADHYRLAHLLEKGHVIRNGTARSYGSTRAFPHIKPVEEWAQQELPRKVKELIEKI